MNPVLFNERIEEMWFDKRLGRKLCIRDGGAEKEVETLYPNWKTSPLFNYESTFGHEQTLVKSSSGNLFEQAPFPVFRIDLTAVDELNQRLGKYKAKAIISVEPEIEAFDVMARVDSLVEDAATIGVPWPGRRRVMPLYIMAHNIRLDESGGHQTYTYSHFFGMGGAWDSTIPENIAKPYCDGFLRSLATFLSDAMSPNTHIARVLPDQEHRSVEWVKARTHYTLITHGHPANRKQVAEGASVASDHQGELTRMAHNRRSHYKMLRHERFRFARGKRILVKACWVGPKSWRDEGGRQIYRILEPMDAQPEVAV